MIGNTDIYRLPGTEVPLNNDLDRVFEQGESENIGIIKQRGQAGMIDRLLLFAQLFIKLQPQPAQVSIIPPALRTRSICISNSCGAMSNRMPYGDFIRKLFQTRQRKDIFDVGIVEGKH